MLTEQIPIACDPNAVPADKRERWMEVGRHMYSAIEEIRNLPDGYAFRLPNTPDMLMIIAEVINMERLCCPFLRFTIAVEPNHGAFWLHFTGGEGVKDYLKLAFESSDLIHEEVAQAAGFSVSARAAMDSVETVIGTAHALNEAGNQSDTRNKGVNTMPASEQIPLACDLTAIDAAEREQHTLTAKQLFAAVEAVSELPDGYSFRLPVDNLMLRSAAEWIANERLCCPFLTFSLKLEAKSKALWLSLTGSEDVKAFIRAEFGNVLSEGVAAGLREDITEG